jgi:hypothetical protein
VTASLETPASPAPAASSSPEPERIGLRAGMAGAGAGLRAVDQARLTEQLSGTSLATRHERAPEQAATRCSDWTNKRRPTRAPACAHFRRQLRSSARARTARSQIVPSGRASSRLRDARSSREERYCVTCRRLRRCSVSSTREKWVLLPGPASVVRSVNCPAGRCWGRPRARRLCVTKAGMTNPRARCLGDGRHAANRARLRRVVGHLAFPRLLVGPAQDGRCPAAAFASIVLAVYLRLGRKKLAHRSTSPRAAGRRTRRIAAWGGPRPRAARTGSPRPAAWARQTAPDAGQQVGGLLWSNQLAGAGARVAQVRHDHPTPPGLAMPDRDLRARLPQIELANLPGPIGRALKRPGRRQEERPDLAQIVVDDGLATNKARRRDQFANLLTRQPRIATEQPMDLTVNGSSFEPLGTRRSAAARRWRSRAGSRRGAARSADGSRGSTTPARGAGDAPPPTAPLRPPRPSPARSPQTTRGSADHGQHSRGHISTGARGPVFARRRHSSPATACVGQLRSVPQ